MTVTLSNGLALAEIADVFGGQSWSFGVGTVPEFTVPAVDLDRVLSRRGLLHDGAVLVNDGHRWEIAAAEREYRGEDIWLTFTARSQFARRLRNMLGPDRQKDVTPGEWIRGKAKKAGGSALVEAGAKARLIVQKRNESVLAVIEALASDTSTEWVFDGDRLLVGTPWWAFQGTPGLPLWPCSMKGRRFTFGEWLSPVGLSTRSSIDDRGQEATATLTVESDTGWKVRPWHRVDLSGADSADNGLWLVTEASREEGKPDTVLTLSRPLKSAPKDGSSGKPASSGIGAGEPIAGSKYSDVARPAGWRGRSVENILSIYNANRGGFAAESIENSCLWYSQEITGYTHEGAGPKQLWASLASGRKHASREIVPGAVVLYATSNVWGHAVVYLGGGRVLSTDANTSGGFASGVWSICPADAIERWGPLLGWYTP